MQFPYATLAIARYKPPPTATPAAPAKGVAVEKPFAFTVGERVEVLAWADEDGDWLRGQLADKREGVFPAGFVRALTTEEQAGEEAHEPTTAVPAVPAVVQQTASEPEPEAPKPIEEDTLAVIPPVAISAPAPVSAPAGVPPPSPVTPAPVAAPNPTPTPVPAPVAALSTPEAPKKPSSLRDRIAALNAAGAGAAAPGSTPPPKASKPSTWSRKVPAAGPTPSTPVASPAVSLPPPTTTVQEASPAQVEIEKKVSVGLSAEDAKASIGQGGSLRDRIKALQGLQLEGTLGKVAPVKKESAEIASTEPATEDPGDGAPPTLVVVVPEGLTAEEVPLPPSAATPLGSPGGMIMPPIPRRAGPPKRRTPTPSPKASAAVDAPPTLEPEKLGDDVPVQEKQVVEEPVEIQVIPKEEAPIVSSVAALSTAAVAAAGLAATALVKPSSPKVDEEEQLDSPNDTAPVVAPFPVVQTPAAPPAAPTGGRPPIPASFSRPVVPAIVPAPVSAAKAIEQEEVDIEEGQESQVAEEEQPQREDGRDEEVPPPVAPRPAAHAAPSRAVQPPTASISETIDTPARALPPLSIPLSVPSVGSPVVPSPARSLRAPVTPDAGPQDEEDGEVKEVDPELARRAALAQRMAKLGGMKMGMGMMMPPVRKASAPPPPPPPPEGTSYLIAKICADFVVGEEAPSVPRRVGGIPAGGVRMPGLPPVVQPPVVEAVEDEPAAETPEEDEDAPEETHPGEAQVEEEEEAAPPPLPKGRPPPSRAVPVAAPVAEPDEEEETEEKEEEVHEPEEEEDQEEEVHEEPEELGDEAEEDEHQDDEEMAPPPPPRSYPAPGRLDNSIPPVSPVVTRGPSLPPPARMPSLPPTTKAPSIPSAGREIGRSESTRSGSSFLDDVEIPSSSMGMGPSDTSATPLARQESHSSHTSANVGRTATPQELEGFSASLGTQIFAAAHSKQGDKSRTTTKAFIDYCFSRATDPLPPTHDTYGIRVASLDADTGTMSSLEIVRSGDIVVLRGSRFKKPLTTIKVGCGGEAHVVVVSGYDAKKRKVHTIEVGEKSGLVEEGSFRVEELKSGKVDFYRVCPRVC